MSFYHGLDMQLPIYMLAVRNTSGGRDIARQVVGAFYMPVEVGPQSATLDELAEAKDIFNYKAKGIFNGEFHRQLDRTADNGWSKFYSFRVSAKDEQYGNYAISAALKPGDFESVLRFAEQKVIELAGEILAGKIDIRPYRIATDSPCGNCKYKPVCRFDWQINDFNLLPSLDKTQVLEKIGGADG
jgi:ATP-dependent helicase/nuclease subunit B